MVMTGSKRAGPALLITVALLAACGDDAERSEGEAQQDNPLQVVTTVAPLTSITAGVGGDLVEITGLIPSGADSHTFEAPPSVARELSEADVLFYNGLGLEESIREIADATMSSDSVMVALGEETISPDEYIFDFSFPEEGGDPNPHLWTNPPMVLTYGEIILDTLSELDPGNADAYERNFAQFTAEVEQLDQAMVEATETVPEGQRKLLTYHDGYPYMAEHYGWDVIGAIQPAHFGEPTAAEVARLADQIEAEGVPAIFGSEVFPSPVLEQLADATGAEYYDELRDDELPGRPGDEEHSWLGLMRFNFITMVDATGGDPSALEAVEPTSDVPDVAYYPQ